MIFWLEYIVDISAGASRWIWQRHLWFNRLPRRCSPSCHRPLNHLLFQTLQTPPHCRAHLVPPCPHPPPSPSYTVFIKFFSSLAPGHRPVWNSFFRPPPTCSRLSSSPSMSSLVHPTLPPPIYNTEVVKRVIARNLFKNKTTQLCVESVIYASFSSSHWYSLLN